MSSRFLTAEWRDLVMLNYEVDPGILAGLVPAGTELDLWQGRALVSVVGMRPVFVCPSFRKHAERDPWAAENWIIHEMLHTLGLGENPPSSREITQRVTERCQ